MAKEKKIEKPDQPQDELSPATAGLSAGLGGSLPNPDTVLLAKGGDFSAYDIVMRDDQFKSTWTQRLARVISAEWYIEPGGESPADIAAAEFIEANIKALDFDKITKYMLYGIFYGYAVGEIIWTVDNNKIVIADILVRDRDRFKFKTGGQLMLEPDIGGQPIPMPDNKFWVYSTGANHNDNPYGLGLAHWLYWPVFFKRGGLQSWLKFLDKYGAPTAKGTFPPGTTQQEKEKLLSALRAISTDAGVAIPEGMQIELIEAQRSGAASYGEMVSLMNAAISKVVLTQTLTTEQGSTGARSMASVHDEMSALVAKEDADTLSQSFNNSVIKWLTEWNFPNALPPKLWRRIEKEPTQAERAALDKTLYDMGYQSTEERVKEIYGGGYERTQNTAPQASPAGENITQFTEAGQDTPERKRAMEAVGAMDDAAISLAESLGGVVDEQVKSLISILQDGGDLQTFNLRLAEMIKANKPSDDMTQMIERGTTGARLLGASNASQDVQ